MGVPPPDTLYLASSVVSFDMSMTRVPPNRCGELLERSTPAFHDLEFLGNLAPTLGSDGDLIPAGRELPGRDVEDQCPAPIQSSERKVLFLHDGSFVPVTNHDVERSGFVQPLRVDLDL